MNRWAMKMFITALAVLMEVTASAQSVAAKSRRDFNQSQARSKSKGSWQCYPYCDGGTYEGRPVRDGRSCKGVVKDYLLSHPAQPRGGQAGHSEKLTSIKRPCEAARV
jgi:hypothetical protein